MGSTQAAQTKIDEPGSNDNNEEMLLSEGDSANVHSTEPNKTSSDEPVTDKNKTTGDDSVTKNSSSPEDLKIKWRNLNPRCILSLRWKIKNS